MMSGARNCTLLEYLLSATSWSCSACCCCCWAMAALRAASRAGVDSPGTWSSSSSTSSKILASSGLRTEPPAELPSSRDRIECLGYLYLQAVASGDFEVRARLFEVMLDECSWERSWAAYGDDVNGGLVDGNRLSRRRRWCFGWSMKTYPFRELAVSLLLFLLYYNKIILITRVNLFTKFQKLFRLWYKSPRQVVLRALVKWVVLSALLKWESLLLNCSNLLEWFYYVACIQRYFTRDPEC